MDVFFPLPLPEESLQSGTQLEKKHDFPPDSLSEAFFPFLYFFLHSVYAAGLQSLKGHASCGAIKNRPDPTLLSVRPTQPKFNCSDYVKAEFTATSTTFIKQTR